MESDAVLCPIWGGRRQLRTEALKEAGRSLPYGLQAEDVQWVLTVPAIWKDGAKGFMRKAAHRAGLIKEEGSRRLVLALEPESACVACDVHKLAKPGDPFMVLDCGGGTVDITMNTCAPSPELPRALEPERLVPRASQAAQREPFAPR